MAKTSKDKLSDTFARGFFAAMDEICRHFGVVPPASVECSTGRVEFAQGEAMHVPCVTIPLHPGIQAASPCHTLEERRTFRDEYETMLRNGGGILPDIPEDMMARLRVFLLHLSRNGREIVVFPIILLHDGERETVLKDTFASAQGDTKYSGDDDIREVAWRGTTVHAYRCGTGMKEIIRICCAILEEWVFDYEAGRKAHGRAVENFLLCAWDDLADTIPGAVLLPPSWHEDRFMSFLVLETDEAVSCLDGAILRKKCERLAGPGRHPAFVLASVPEDGGFRSTLHGPFVFDELGTETPYDSGCAAAADDSLKIAEWTVAETRYGPASMQPLPSGTSPFEEEVGKFSCRVLNALRVFMPDSENVLDIMTCRNDGILVVTGKRRKVSGFPAGEPDGREKEQSR